MQVSSVVFSAFLTIVCCHNLILWLTFQLSDVLKLPLWQNVVPQNLDSFQLRDVVFTNTSLLLKRDGQIVGWIVCHLIRDNTVQGTSLMIHHTEATGQGLNMIAEVISRRKIGHRVIFITEADNQKMLHSAKKYMTGGESQLFEQRLRFL